MATLMIQEEVTPYISLTSGVGVRALGGVIEEPVERGLNGPLLLIRDGQAIIVHCKTTRFVG